MCLSYSIEFKGGDNSKYSNLRNLGFLNIREACIFLDAFTFRAFLQSWGYLGSYLEVILGLSWGHVGGHGRSHSYLKSNIVAQALLGPG